ncbi:hypothetical protein, partial [Escherichia coli]|uniref:hypothetical protein n=1 Tax=Escherichia coli TaxID=562 RepID=UPI0019530C3F
NWGLTTRSIVTGDFASDFRNGETIGLIGSFEDGKSPDLFNSVVAGLSYRQAIGYRYRKSID